MSHDPHASEPVEPVIPDPSYQDKDIRLDLIIKFTIGIFVTIFFAIVAMVLMQRMLLKDKPTTLASGQVPERILPPVQGPRLQVWPQVDLDQYYQEQADRLQQFKVLDVDKGLVQIPIQQAKDLALDKNLFPVERP